MSLVLFASLVACTTHAPAPASAPPPAETPAPATPPAPSADPSQAALPDFHRWEYGMPPEHAVPGFDGLSAAPPPVHDAPSGLLVVHPSGSCHKLWVDARRGPPAGWEGVPHPRLGQVWFPAECSLEVPSCYGPECPATPPFCGHPVLCPPEADEARATRGK